MTEVVWSLIWGFVALLVLWALAGVFGGAWNPLTLAEGADRRLSTSKLQWLFWTAVVFFTYTVMYAARAIDGVFEPITDIPKNVLYAMGFSAVTMAAAKGITVSYINSGRVKKDTAAGSSVTQLVTDDESVPDLSKIQMLAWTVLAGVIYLIRAMQMLGQYGTGDTDLSQLPDIDNALMVLMGLGQGAYLGKKAASMDTSQVAARPEAG